MHWLRWFFAGALAVPLFHQGVLLAMNAAELVSRPPWSMRATEPFGVPSIVSLSFWGGVWGVLLGLLLLDGRTPNAAWWIKAVMFGAIAPTLVAMFVVPPLKGLEIEPSWQFLIGGMILNGAWGLGTALFARIFDRMATRSRI